MNVYEMDRTEDFHQYLLLFGGEPIKPSRRSRTIANFDRIARECHAKVAKIRSFLQEKMKLYADFENGLTDEERDKIDLLVSEALGEAESTIRTLDASSLEQEGQNMRDHQKGVAMLLLDATRGVQEIANSARNLRQRHIMSAREKLCAVVTTNERITIVDETAKETLEDLDENEIMMLQQENQQLEEHLSTVLEEARRIERNAAEVSTLLTMFSEEVMNQHQVIGSIYDEAQKNVDIVNRVPQELNKAAEHGKGFRRFMLGFLLISGLLLLLLDWMS